MATAYISHPACLLHDNGPYHPESPGRLRAIEDHLIATGLFHLMHHYEAPEATRAQLERVHHTDYLDRLAAIRPDGRLIALDPDTVMGEHTLDAARRAAGAGILGCDLVLGGEMASAFCAIRPPGHHAEPSRAMGFCLFNNVAVAAAHALTAHALERVAVVDFDVHHGNGTEAMFADDERVLFCSAFQHPFYPWTEQTRDRPNVIHSALAAGSGSKAFRTAIERDWLPALRRFRPEIILVSAGFDGHRQDDMAQLLLDELDFGWVTERIMEVAQLDAQGRVVSLLEGGYHLDALGRSVGWHLRALMGIQG